LENNELWEKVSKRVLAQYAKGDAKRTFRHTVCKTCGGPLFRKVCILCTENRW